MLTIIVRKQHGRSHFFFLHEKKHNDLSGNYHDYKNIQPEINGRAGKRNSEMLGSMVNPPYAFKCLKIVIFSHFKH